MGNSLKIFEELQREYEGQTEGGALGPVTVLEYCEIKELKL